MNIEEKRPSTRDKSATLRKIRAAGSIKAALSPHKSPDEGPEKGLTGKFKVKHLHYF